MLKVLIVLLFLAELHWIKDKGFPYLLPSVGPGAYPSVQVTICLLYTSPSPRDS